MGFTIPNAADAAFPDQAQVDKVDLDIVAAGAQFNGVTSGYLVTTTGAANGSVSVALGEIRAADGKLYSKGTSTTLAIGANSSGNPRLDLITVPSTGGTPGTPVVTAGTAAANPAFPAIPAASVCVAAVYVPNGHTSTTTIPANTIVDKRMIVPAWMFNNSRSQHNIIRATNNIAALLLKDNGSPAWPLLQIDDPNDAPILTVNNAGGGKVNDRWANVYTIVGPEAFCADIYGNTFQGVRVPVCTYAFSGPPGNMLRWTEAVHELFEGTRFPSIGQWGIVGNCTIAAGEHLGIPPTNSPTGYRSAVRITNTGGPSAWISTPGGTSAIAGQVPGQVLSAVTHVRFVTAAAARNAQVRLEFYTSGGSFISGTSGGLVSVPNSGTAWTTVSVTSVTVPATAAFVNCHLLIASNSGEVHDMCGYAVFRGREAVFAPPAVAQNATTPHTEGGAFTGDRWIRTDKPSVPGKREYVCTVGGVTELQRWRPVDSTTVYRTEVDLIEPDAVMMSVPDWVFPVEANEAYTVKFDFLVVSNATTNGFQFELLGPASPAMVNMVLDYQTSATAWTTQNIQSFTTFTLVTSVYAATPTPIAVRATLQLINGANAGDVTFQFRSELGTGANQITLKKGGLCMVT